MPFSIVGQILSEAGFVRPPGFDKLLPYIQSLPEFNVFFRLIEGGEFPPERWIKKRKIPLVVESAQAAPPPASHPKQEETAAASTGRGYASAVSPPVDKDVRLTFKDGKACYAPLHVDDPTPSPGPAARPPASSAPDAELAELLATLPPELSACILGACSEPGPKIGSVNEIAIDDGRDYF